MDARLHVLVASFLLLLATSDAIGLTFNVIDHGAVPDGKTDSTQAFQDAWYKACDSDGRARVFVPKGTFLVGPLLFKGPCKGPRIVFQVRGNVVASTDLKLFDGQWISFQYIDRLIVTGKGKFDGRGTLAWPYHDCKDRNKCVSHLPTSLSFSFVTNSTIQRISSVDSMFFHMHLFQCQNVKLSGLNIRAPGDSPNTDGIHVAESSDIEILDSVIGTGDDCISIGPGGRNISISGIFCGPGHGISVGSLGKDPNEGDVVGLNVRNCTLTGTTNGVRIKTWQESPDVSLASNFTYDDIVMNNVSNPIIIDQEYCPSGSCSGKSPSLVKISNIMYRRIRGSSRTRVAVDLLCSNAMPCEGIELDDIDLTYNGTDRKEATSSCTNVNGYAIGTVIPPSCF